MVLKGYLQVDLVTDCYFKSTMKDAERTKRGTSSKIITSPRFKVPREFHNFLCNGENKTRMIELIFQTIKEKRVYCLNLLKTTKLILSREKECATITLSNCCDCPNLLSNHEETDTNVIAHSMQALQVRTN